MLIIGVLYFLGVAMVLYPMVGNVYTLSSSRSAIQSYQTAVQEMDEPEIEKKLANAHTYNQELAEGTINEVAAKAINGEDNIMCYVEIPSLSIYLPVYYGTSDEVLNKGCGWLENTSLPVGGLNTHSVISGHTGLPNAEMFTKLDIIKKGAMFYIYVLNDVLAYRVESIEAVTPEHTELLTIVPGKDYVTLLTCTPYGINDKRLLVRGERVSYTKPEEKQEVSEVSEVSAPNEADSGLSSQIRHEWTIIILIGVTSVIVFVVASVWVNLAVSKYQKQVKLAQLRERSEDNHAEKEEE